MNNALYAVVSGSVAALERLDIVTNNIANANTAGFKAQYLVLTAEDPNASAQSGSGLGLAVTRALRTVTDLSQGAIRRSGNPLDVAIEGSGFFVVTTPEGERYTRQGQFHLDSTGRVVTSSGLPVQGEGGDDLQLPTGTIEIDSNGGITVDGVITGRFRLVRFVDEGGVVPQGGALFAATDEAGVTDLDPGEMMVLQGSVEGANIDVIRGLMELIDVARGYEAYMRATQDVNDMVGIAIEQIGGMT